MTGIQVISQEREEQIVKHGRSVVSDKENNTEFQLADAAMALMSPIPEGLEEIYISSHINFPPIGWDRRIWENLLRKPYKERLAIAGALIAAEIDRIS